MAVATAAATRVAAVMVSVARAAAATVVTVVAVLGRVVVMRAAAVTMVAERTSHWHIRRHPRRLHSLMVALAARAGAMVVTVDLATVVTVVMVVTMVAMQAAMVQATVQAAMGAVTVKDAACPEVELVKVVQRAA